MRCLWKIAVSKLQKFYCLTVKFIKFYTLYYITQNCKM